MRARSGRFSKRAWIVLCKDKEQQTMRPTVRLNLLLFAGIVLIAGVNVAMFSYRFWGPAFNQSCE